MLQFTCTVIHGDILPTCIKMNYIRAFYQLFDLRYLDLSGVDNFEYLSGT